MAVYRLVCSCGQAHRVETSAAGRIIECSCGNQLVIPSMRQIRALPLWEDNSEENSKGNSEDIPENNPENKPEEKAPAAGTEGSRPKPAAGTRESSPKENAKASAAGVSPPKTGGVLRGHRKGFLLIGAILVVVFSCLLLHTIRHKPRPIEVLQKQRRFLIGKTVVQRDSLPVTMEDFNYYIDQIDEETLSFYQMINSVTVTEENLEAARKVFPDINVGDRFLPIKVELGQWVEINDWLLDRMTPVMAYRYFDQLKNGPQLSDNFYENLDMLRTQYKFKTAMYSILIALSVLLCAVPWMLPKHDYVVGAMRGSVWKA